MKAGFQTWAQASGDYNLLKKIMICNIIDHLVKILGSSLFYLIFRLRLSLP